MKSHAIVTATLLCFMIHNVVNTHIVKEPLTIYNINEDSSVNDSMVPYEDWKSFRNEMYEMIGSLKSSNQNSDSKDQGRPRRVPNPSADSKKDYVLAMIKDTKLQLSKLYSVIEKYASEIDNEIVSLKDGPLQSTKQDDYAIFRPMSDQEHAEYLPSASPSFPITASDCSDLLVQGYKRSGVYEISPFRCKCRKPIKVYCDMDTLGGGWTVLVQRQQVKNSVNFSRYWEDYKYGFGSAETEYWIGNENMHQLTNSRKYDLRIEAEDESGAKAWANYNTFSVADEKTKYKLTITGYDALSMMNDGLSNSNGMSFSSLDRDNDRDARSCAVVYQSSWWFNKCYLILPTGKQGLKKTGGIHIHSFSKTEKKAVYSTTLQIKIRPKMCADQLATVRLDCDTCNG